MGETRIHFMVYGANAEAVDLEAVVDTGATFSNIPESVAARLELEAKYETEVELGDGMVIGRKLTLAEVEIEDGRCEKTCFGRHWRGGETFNRLYYRGAFRVQSKAYYWEIGKSYANRIYRGKINIEGK